MNNEERLKKIKESITPLGTGMEVIDFYWLIEQAEQLHGTAHRYGYKDMYSKCNQDYAGLNWENKQLKENLKDLCKENEELRRQLKYKSNIEYIGELPKKPRIE